MIYFPTQNNSFKINFINTYLIVDSFQLVLILNKNKKLIFDELKSIHIIKEKYY